MSIQTPPPVPVTLDETALTPMMRQYMEIKSRNPDTLLLYRMGDFYELFFEDAVVASKVLGLTLTSRNHGGTDKTPLAGFPFHALDRYANRLVKSGYKIAICEQVEDPKTAKGIVRRDIIEVITAGTAVEETFINEKSNTYIMALALEQERTVGLAFCDLSTGEFMVEELALDRIEEELARIDPAEVLVSDTAPEVLKASVRSAFSQARLSVYNEKRFSFDSALATITDHFQVASVQGLGLESYRAGICAAGGLLAYLKEQKKSDLRHIAAIKPRSLSGFAELDPATIRNLELLRPLQTGEQGNTLLWILDHTATPMGGRLLRRWITHPLKNIGLINERLDCVEWFRNDLFVKGETQLHLKGVADIERLIGRITFERANARDCVALKNSMQIFPALAKLLSASPIPAITRFCDALSGFEPLTARIEAILTDAPPLSIKEGGMIRHGVFPELDEIADAAANGKQWVAKLQQEERQRTGISSLKVSFNKVFGYYIEVTNANKDQVPQSYIRKQTLVNAERFITPELKEMESRILGAEERMASLEYELFTGFRAEIACQCAKIQLAAEALAAIDVLVTLAQVAADYRYVRPVLSDGSDFVIVEGRHPVVEATNMFEQFIPNDTELNAESCQIMLITGPNMAGKSTYLRQNALIAIMAQMGSFVPASRAEIGIVDKFFTRVGASDRLARGQSTFLVEMIEVASILNNATNASFVLLDEVGRGTSTFDGISIAWAVAEHLHETPNCMPRTLFATHYHELTELELLFPRIKNFHSKVKEWNDQIIFLRKIDKGSCDHSYGIQVARLAGVPRSVILRAREILDNLENMELTPEHKPVLARSRERKSLTKSAQVTIDAVQMNLLDTAKVEIMQQLHSLAIEKLTPLDALNILAQLKEKADTF